MTPAEHIAEAEALLDQSYGGMEQWNSAYQRELVGKATVHALIAIAVELGAPHLAAPAGGEGSAQAAPPD